MNNKKIQQHCSWFQLYDIFEFWRCLVTWFKAFLKKKTLNLPVLPTTAPGHRPLLKLSVILAKKVHFPQNSSSLKRFLVMMFGLENLRLHSKETCYKNSEPAVILGAKFWLVSFTCPSGKSEEGSFLKVIKNNGQIPTLQPPLQFSKMSQTWDLQTLLCC